MRKEKIKVIFDANFLFIPFQFRIDIFREIESLIGHFEPVILSTTLEELMRLSNRKSIKVRKNALSALDLAKKCNIIEVRAEVGESYDDVLLRVAKEYKSIVATNDSKLRKRLREAGVATIYLRQRAYLQINGYMG